MGQNLVLDHDLHAQTKSKITDLSESSDVILQIRQIRVTYSVLSVSLIVCSKIFTPPI